jgi:hypothetical protein
MGQNNNPQNEKMIRMTHFEASCLSFFESIQVLWENKHYITAMKLLLMNIDTMAYLQYRENKGNHFKQWLKDYVDLSDVGITEDEIWEHRNALLHTSTLHSMAVKKGKVAYLVPHLGTSHSPPPEFTDEMRNRLGRHYEGAPKFYSMIQLYEAVIWGVRKFAAALEKNPKLKAEAYENFGDLVTERSVIEMMRASSKP